MLAALPTLKRVSRRFLGCRSRVLSACVRALRTYTRRVGSTECELCASGPLPFPSLSSSSSWRDRIPPPPLRPSTKHVQCGRSLKLYTPLRVRCCFPALRCKTSSTSSTPWSTFATQVNPPAEQSQFKRPHAPATTFFSDWVLHTLIAQACLAHRPSLGGTLKGQFLQGWNRMPRTVSLVYWLVLG